MYVVHSELYSLQSTVSITAQTTTVVTVLHQKLIDDVQGGFISIFLFKKSSYPVACNYSPNVSQFLLCPFYDGEEKNNAREAGYQKILIKICFMLSDHHAWLYQFMQIF